MEAEYFKDIESDAVYASFGIKGFDGIFRLGAPGGAWEFLSADSAEWAAAHRRIYHVHGAEKVDPAELASSLPELPMHPREPINAPDSPVTKELAHVIPKNPLARAEEYMNKREFTEAGRCYEMAASAADDKREAVACLKKAAEAYDKKRKTEDAVRCYTEASQFLEKMEKAECLMACFGVYILEIAGCQYECSYEWRGEMNDNHDDDHDYYQGEIRKYQKEAEKILRQALSIEGVNRKKIIKQAKNEWKKRKKDGGWGSPQCLTIIENVTRSSAD